jgi:hypothetical protein
MLRLGVCLDLLDPYNVKYVKGVFEGYRENEAAAGRTLLQNANHHKYLDCAVFQYAYAIIEQESGGGR